MHSSGLRQSDRRRNRWRYTRRQQFMTSSSIREIHSTWIKRQNGKNYLLSIYLGVHCNIFVHYVLFAPRLNLFSREGSPRIRAPSGSEIRPAPQLIRHLIGNVWAQIVAWEGRASASRVHALVYAWASKLIMKYRMAIGRDHHRFARPRVSRAWPPRVILYSRKKGVPAYMFANERPLLDLAFHVIPSIGDASLRDIQNKHIANEILWCLRHKIFIYTRIFAFENMAFDVT